MLHRRDLHVAIPAERIATPRRSSLLLLCAGFLEVERREEIAAIVEPYLAAEKALISPEAFIEKLRSVVEKKPIQYYGTDAKAERAEAAKMAAELVDELARSGNDKIPSFRARVLQMARAECDQGMIRTVLVGYSSSYTDVVRSLRTRVSLGRRPPRPSTTSLEQLQTSPLSTRTTLFRETVPKKKFRQAHGAIVIPWLLELILVRHHFLPHRFIFFVAFSVVYILINFWYGSTRHDGLVFFRQSIPFWIGAVLSGKH